MTKTDYLELLELTWGVTGAYMETLRPMFNNNDREGAARKLKADHKVPLVEGRVIFDCYFKL